MDLFREVGEILRDIQNIARGPGQLVVVGSAGAGNSTR